MSLYVEVMCDVRKEGHDPRSILVHRCWSNRNDNAQGHSVATARKQAKREGWKLNTEVGDICPGCQADV